MFMGRLKEMPHNQVLMYVCACVPRACTQYFTDVLREHRMRVFQGLKGVLAHEFFILFQRCRTARKIAPSNQAGCSKHAHEDVF
jgi:hypothetical protein